MDTAIKHMLTMASGKAIIVWPFLTGVVVHLAIRPWEIDAYTVRIIAIYLVSFSALLSAFHIYGALSIIDSLYAVSVLASSFNTGLFGSILTYRAFFHRLHRFPGPFLAKLSRFYAMRVAASTKKTHLSLQKVNQDYGDFVRVGPRELAIFRSSAVNAIYGSTSKCQRPPQYDNPSNDPAKSSILGTRNVEIHRRRKRAWDRGLGAKALKVYESRVLSKVNLLLSRIALHEGVPVDMTELSMFFGFDVMGDIGFSKDFNMLESGKGHPAIAGLQEQTVYIGVLGTVPWLFTSLVKAMDKLSSFGIKTSFNIFLEWCSRELEAKRNILKREKENFNNQAPQDVMSWLLKAEEEGDSSAPPGEGAFQEDSRVLIVAGSDTTSTAIANTLYYFTKYPTVYQKLQRILDAEFPGGEVDWTYTKAKSIPYLDAIIHETLRLKPSVTSALPRTTPPSGLQIDEVFIPGDTIVSAPVYAIQRDPRYWDEPNEFIPERWDNLTPEKAPFLAFTRGQYACPGKNLAMLELRMVISRIAMKYNLEFVSVEDAEEFDHGALDTFTMTLPPLPLILTRR